MIATKKKEAVEFYIGDLETAVRRISTALEEDNEEDLVDAIAAAKDILEEME